MKRIIFFMCSVIPYFALSMEKEWVPYGGKTTQATRLARCDEGARDVIKDDNYQAMYDEFKIAGMQQLTEEEKQAIRPDNYKIRRQEGINALHSFAQHVVEYAYESKRSKTLSEKKLTKKANKYACYMIGLRDSSLGLKSIEITDVFTAKTFAVSLLTEEEQKSLQRDEYCADRDKAYATLVHYAYLTAEELAKRNLLPCSREEFERKFVEEKIQELDTMWSLDKK
jgi:hypothetical protein